MSDSEALLAAAREWLAEDPDPDTRAELTALLNAGDLEIGRASCRERVLRLV